jgi:hypothetical protein
MQYHSLIFSQARNLEQNINIAKNSSYSTVQITTNPLSKPGLSNGLHRKCHHAKNIVELQTLAFF